VSGFVKTDEFLRDETFGVAEPAVKLVREVEMFQWVESSARSSESKLGGSEVTTTTYEYTTEWRSDLVDSSGFQSPNGHDNPRVMPFEARTWTAASVKLGAFELASSQVARLSRREPLAAVSAPGSLPEGARVHDGAVFFGSDPASPRVGEARVRFYVVRPGPVSVVARQVGFSFEPYRAEAGGSVFLIEEGIASADAMFQGAEAANATLTWGLRLLGFGLMFFGLGTVLKPISVAGDVLPGLGRLLGTGVGLVAGLVAAFLTFATVGVAWFVYRPLLGLALLGLGLGALWLLARASRRAAVPPPPPPPPAPPPPLPRPAAE
jgi:hypothetical protein